MKKRALSNLLCLCIVATLLPTVTIPVSAAEGISVRTEATLRAALAGYTDIIIFNDISLTSTEPLTVNRNVTIYLSGHKLTITSATIQGGRGGSTNGDNSSGSSGHAGQGGYGIYAKGIGAFTITDSTINGETGGGVTSTNYSVTPAAMRALSQ